MFNLIIHEMPEGPEWNTKSLTNEEVLDLIMKRIKEEKNFFIFIHQNDGTDKV